MDAEKAILDVLEGTATLDFNLVMVIFGIGLAVLWFFVTIWVWLDSGERSSSIVFRLFSTLLVLPFNLLGLIIYLIIRPKETIEDVFWADLDRRYLLFQTEELVDCERCGYLLRPGFNSCPNCGLGVKHECVSCKVMIDNDWKYCPFCNTQQRVRAVKEEELTKEVIQERVEQTEVQVKEAVKSGETRYKKKGVSMVEKLGSKVIYVTKRLGRGLKTTFTGAKKNVSSKASDVKKSASKSTSKDEKKTPKVEQKTKNQTDKSAKAKKKRKAKKRKNKKK